MDTNFGSDDALGATSGIDALSSGHADLADPGNYTDETTLDDDSYGDAPSDDNETITLDYAGDEQEYTANEDLDGDGSNETAIVDRSDGSRMVLTDSDGDGEADRARLLDVEGNLVDAKHVDDDGQWVRDDVTVTLDPDGPTDAISVNDDQPQDDSTADDQPAGPSVPTDVPDGTVYVNLGGGNAGIAEATVDLNSDGGGDSVLLHSSTDDSRLLVTDADGDGLADMAGRYDAEGRLVATMHPDESGVLTPDNEIDRTDGDSDAATYSVDPDTGEWTDNS